jgi:hypothetical protein
MKVGNPGFDSLFGDDSDSRFASKDFPYRITDEASIHLLRGIGQNHPHANQTRY